MVIVLSLIIILLAEIYLRKHSTYREQLKVKLASWLQAYLEQVLNFFPEAKEDKLITSVVIVAFLGMPLLLLGLLNLIFATVLGFFGSLLLSALVLYCFLGCSESNTEESLLVSAHEKIYGLIFWFILLGPYGVVIYWQLALSNQILLALQMEDSNLVKYFKALHALVAWLPARVTGFIYALVGDFVACFKCWLQHMRDLPGRSTTVLEECGSAAVGITEDGNLYLVQRTFIAWIVLGIVFKLIVI